jgi:predicted RNase H-like HicB family nuclease
MSWTAILPPAAPGEVLGAETRSRHDEVPWKQVARMLQADEDGDLLERAWQRAVELASDAGHGLGSGAGHGRMTAVHTNPPSKEPPLTKNTYTAILEKEGDGYVALCPEFDVASQGATVEEATANLREAVELFLETADPAEIKRREHTEVFVTRFEATVG